MQAYTLVKWAIWLYAVEVVLPIVIAAVVIGLTITWWMKRHG